MLYVVKDGKVDSLRQDRRRPVEIRDPGVLRQPAVHRVQPGMDRAADHRAGEPAAESCVAAAGSAAAPALRDRHESEGESTTASVVDAGSVDWGSVNMGSDQPSCRRRGPTNVLGKVKFVYPNPHTGLHARHHQARSVRQADECAPKGTTAPRVVKPEPARGRSCSPPTRAWAADPGRGAARRGLRQRG